MKMQIYIMLGIIELALATASKDASRLDVVDIYQDALKRGYRHLSAWGTHSKEEADGLARELAKIIKKHT